MLFSTLLALAAVLIMALPLAWKWGLGVARVGAAVIVLVVASGLVVALPASFVDIGTISGALLVAFLALSLALGALLFRFYRDPERRPPEGDGLVLSPADGEIVYVRESRGGYLPVSTKLGRDYSLKELTRTPLASDDAVVIGIGLSFLDVHVNRAPIDGRVTLMRRFAGRFGSLRRPEMVFENERVTLLIEGGGLELGVVLIASRLVRRIVSFVSEGQELRRGDRIGMIRIGSQVDVVLPLREELKITIEPGQRVKGAESVIAMLERTEVLPEPPDSSDERAGAAVHLPLRSELEARER
jgi:phosphatidylserine decarboxylase